MVTVAIDLQAGNVSVLSVNCIHQTMQNYSFRRLLLLWVRFRPHSEYSAFSYGKYSAPPPLQA